jgi:hypothetical protein
MFEPRALPRIYRSWTGYITTIIIITIKKTGPPLFPHRY